MTGPLSQFTVVDLRLLMMALWWLAEGQHVNEQAVPDWRERIFRMRQVLRAAIEERTA